VKAKAQQARAARQAATEVLAHAIRGNLARYSAGHTFHRQHVGSWLLLGTQSFSQIDY